MEIAKLHQLFLQHPTVCTDTRKAKIGSIFFALKGENFDANYFAKDAIKKGCELAVVDDQSAVLSEQYILVDDVLETLQNLANFHRQYCNTKIIGITGTNGKTTTKELIKSVLETTYDTLATEGNLNNHIGVPLTLLRLTPATEIAVIEMGANHRHEIAELCAIAEPDYGIITNVGKGHIEGFGSLEGVIKTKTELYEAVEKKNGTLFVNADNEILSEKASATKCHLYSYGSEHAQVTGKFIAASPFLNMEIENVELQTKLLGAYNFENILAAFAIGKFFDVPKNKNLNALANYVPKNNRSQLIETKYNTILLDAYNANPTSMKLSILNFIQTEYPHKMLILGDMLELGHLSETAHEEIITLIKDKGLAPNTWLVGTHFLKRKTDSFLYFNDAEQVIDYLSKNPIRGNQILIKGSRGIKLETLVKML
ncbi:UDP-N-acetylmuramoyl-tripeptide--D-alanyl-D-alanine ligase [Balneicella halophila]|nr:UDP-N-acetylmuramoyl-tripeptide--D-alanyl-D-alanine ligase [Balneicella halophila]